MKRAADIKETAGQAAAKGGRKKRPSIQMEFSKRDKVLFPEDGITKGELIDYYERVADIMLPHVIDRPTTLLRFPEGIHGFSFYQKEAPDYFPDWIEQVAVEKKPTAKDPDDEQCQVLCERPETLMYLANQGCITPHTWLSRKPLLHQPDRLIFDFDPSGEDFDFDWVKEGARQMRAMLEALDLPVFVMTTGSRGLHVVVPIKPELDFKEIKPFAKKLAEQLIEKHPERFTIEMLKKNRGDKIFVDYLRNEYSATSVPPYAVRPKPGAPVATPLTWDELDGLKSSRQYTLRNVFDRLEKGGDRWEGIDRGAVSLKKRIAGR